MTALFKVIRYISIGLAFGFVITTICLWTMNGPDETLRQMTGWLIASVIYGLVTLIFEVEALSCLVATIIHLAVVFATTITTGWLLGYGESLWELVRDMAPIFLVIYVFIYAVMIGVQKYEAREVNKKLSQK